MIELKKNRDDGYRFHLKNEDGHILLKSIAFPSKEMASDSIQDLRALENTIERKTNYEGKFLFNVKNQKGQLIGHSQLYNSEAGMENGIKHIKNVLARL